MKKASYGVLALLLLSAVFAGCTTKTVSVPVSETQYVTPSPTPTLHQYAYAAITTGLDMFPVGADGTVGLPVLQQVSSLTNGVLGVATIPDGSMLVAVTGTGAATQLEAFSIDPTTGALTSVGGPVTVPNLRGAIAVDADGNGAAVIAGGGATGQDQVTTFLVDATGVVRTGASTRDVSATNAGPNPVHTLTINSSGGVSTLLAGDAFNDGGTDVANIDQFVLTPVANNAPTLGALTAFQNGLNGAANNGESVFGLAALDGEVIYANNAQDFVGDGTGDNGGALSGVPLSGTPGGCDAGDFPVSSASLGMVDGVLVGVFTTVDYGDPDIFPVVVSGNTIHNFANVHLAGDGRMATNVNNAGVNDPTGVLDQVYDNNTHLGTAILASPGAAPTLLVLTIERGNTSPNLMLSGIPIDVANEELGAANKQSSFDGSITLPSDGIGPSNNLLATAVFNN